MNLPVIARALSGHLEMGTVGGAVTPWRLPAALRRHAPSALVLMSEFTSGVRLRLHTDADRLVIDADLVRLAMRHLGRPESPARLVAVDDEGEHVAEIDETGVVVETHDRRYERGEAVRSRITFDLARAGLRRDVDVWLPHDAGITLRSLVATLGGSPARLAAARIPARARWVHHGSSISQGASATLPTGTWPARAAAALGLELTNLGFGGNAMLDPVTARAIAATPADVITLKIGINIVGGDVMRERAFVPALHGFIDLVREGHPATPVVLISALGCAALEHSPGPARPGPDGRVTAASRSTEPGDGILTLEKTRILLAEVTAARRVDDPNLHYLDGTRLLAADEGGRLTDGLHPDDAGHALIAERFAARAADPAEGVGAVFSGVRSRLS